MKFGFLAHPVNTGQLNYVRAAALLSSMAGERTGRAASGTARHTVPMPMFGTVVSATGDRCEGDLRYLPHTAEDLLRRATDAVDHVVAQVEDLRRSGAQLVGLGGATSIVGNRGLTTQRRVDVPLTSGNSLTTYSAHELLRTVVARLGRRPSDVEIGIVGFPGAIGLAMARLLLDDGCRLHLVHRKGRIRPEQLLDELPADAHERVTIGDDVAECLRRTRLIVAASSAGGLIDCDDLRPGSVVVDVALPRDVRRPVRERRDVLVLDGGLVSASDAVVLDGMEAATSEQINGCLAETVVLALEERAESFSIGRELDPGRVREIGELARRHGFLPSAPSSWGRLVGLDRLDELPGWSAARPDPAEATRRRFRDNVNPPLAGFYAVHGMDRVFTRGSGSTLTTADGVEYLDFIGGYGSLNVGHNHPAVTAAVTEFVASGEPTFVQYASIPHRTAELAERLCEIAPGGMRRVFFSNSGAEAVEAALKLARAATGRTRFVHAENSYHGKTFGALSVTGRDHYRDPFRPVLPDCVGVPFGDEDALREAIAGAAAFIVEPVQGEGGVVLPPPGYLTAAQRICREAGAVFIVDEIQTGLGRTGAMFACEHEGVEPDVLCVAKSLSGGLVPIAATLSTSEVWDAAYGSSSGSLLHTSTFGGGNLASVAALATLDLIESEKLAARAEVMGRRLREALTEACAPFEFVGEVRGIGLMNAIAFDARYDGAVRTAVEDMASRLPGDFRAIARLLPDPVREVLRQAGSSVETALGDLLCLRFVAAMGRDHRILTFVTANRNQVVRLQPPLVVTEAELDRFAESARAVCETVTGIHNNWE
ncbi:aminotransferase class III-fold pyridoxal phosphate-dependent enzyme [Saccharopolyspora erythraea]|uniref:aminotransferase class III-fold pyridoxal phosphate-dependent enzyme n=1 Tax=Saccharopolyspora erythraea TaxID=1836 RepID=UPI001BEDDD4A|nr:aminotransferase class III-fold pyridoxal phosphate-dependent enzyme [Saccharopolyspora erythraea]QUH02494.1 aminotransferase class III-fold pyridoxal phosphate-dependent enzyme [Saccharopolyspora erythraea]